MTARVEAWGLNTSTGCDNRGCREVGDFLACQVISMMFLLLHLLQGCLGRRYCSLRCRLEAWGGHREECPSMMGMVFGEAVYPTSPMVTREEHTLLINRYRGLYEEERRKREEVEEKVVEVKRELEEVKTNFEESEAKKNDLLKEVATLKYVKAGNKVLLRRW